MQKFLFPAASVLLVLSASALPFHSEEDGSVLLRSVRNQTNALFPNKPYGLSFTVEVGTSENPKTPQHIQLTFSTASTSTFIAKVGFQKGPSDGPIYDPTRSTSAILINKTYVYTDGPVTLRGETYSDIFTLYHKIPTVRQHFGAVTDLAGIKRMVVNGQLGLAWKPYNSDPKDASASLIHELLVASARKMYLIYADRYTQAFCLGCEGMKECPKDEFRFVPIMVGKPVPMLEVESLEMAEFHFATRYPALFDANVNSIELPSALLKAALKLYKPKFNRNLQSYIVDCNVKNVKWKFDFGGVEAEMDNKQFVVDAEQEEPKCMLLIGQSWDDIYTLGSPFFYKFCVLFDTEREHIGIAESVKDPA